MKRVLFHPDPTDQAPGGPSETPPPPPAGPPEGPQGPGPVQAPPPAATIVVEGTKTERELVLEKDLKDRESRINELEDENHRLKSIPAPPRPTRAAKGLSEELSDWLEGGD